MFATVLGLLAWVYLATEITVYSAEVNVVLERRLWPRSIVQPPLTEATGPAWRCRPCRTSGAPSRTSR